MGLGDINESGMAETLALLAGEGHFCARLDVRDRAQWDAALAAFAEGSAGRINVLHNNAGVAYGGAFDEAGEQEVHHPVAIHFRRVSHGARALPP
ncbi:MAG TPA: SDR family NAD(P)-dependent oxidoreductase, partial [Novosphingobium sp.]|nr:SDR family NAD(P)-dependent oxidoreductase [Novosphingobium sp.]